MIKVLFEGVHEEHWFTGYYEIHSLTSSVTLIQDKGINVLIDTGSAAFKDILFKKLQEHSLKPEDVYYICNTHFHLDHTSNDIFFKNAEVFVGRSKLDYKTGVATIYNDASLMKYPCEIQMIHTPGHTFDHTSYLYEENGLRYVCAGDAIREDFIRQKIIPRVHEREKYLESIRTIFDSADIIIPGHGRIIEGDLKKELYELVCSKDWKLF